MNIPFLSFGYMHGLLRQEAVETFTRFYDDQYYVLGRGTDDFEKEYAAYNQTQYCVGISNGLDALFIALKVLGIGPGDEVIVPSNTFIATVLAVSYTGATPVFTEPDINTYNLDSKKAEEAITPFTKAIIPVHLYGQACKMDDIMQFAAKHNLFVIEDNAQAHGAAYNHKITGSFGHVNATSFYPGKNLGALGDAGAITTDNEHYAAQAKMLRNYGSSQKYYNEAIGFNKRMDELQARFLSVKLKYLDGFTQKRQQIASWYNSALQNIQDVVVPFVTENATHVYHLYVIRIKKRDALQEYLKDKGIGTLIHYPVPPHLQKAYKHLGFKAGDYPIAETIAETCLSLPMYPGLTQDEVSYICDCIKSFFTAKGSSHLSGDTTSTKVL
jgi:dTDP-4-amino-4,6-dideoxygalactose transaminase